LDEAHINDGLQWPGGAFRLSPAENAGCLCVARMLKTMKPCIANRHDAIWTAQDADPDFTSIMKAPWFDQRSRLARRLLLRLSRPCLALPGRRTHQLYSSSERGARFSLHRIDHASDVEPKPTRRVGFPS
jgi:hypothetical protein